MSLLRGLNADARPVTTGGLGLIFFRRSAPVSIAGLILIILPHLIGAPEVPTSLSRQFVTLTRLVFWSILGGSTSVPFAHFDQTRRKDMDERTFKKAAGSYKWSRTSSLAAVSEQIVQKWARSHKIVE